jgi:hypothetical protein
MSGAITPLPNTPSLNGAQLKHRDFTFTFTFTSYIMIRGKTFLIIDWNNSFVKETWPTKLALKEVRTLIVLWVRYSSGC